MDLSAIASAASTQLAAQSTPSAPPLDPGALAAERFRAMMQPDAAAPAASVQAALQAAFAAPAPGAPSTLGSQILAGLRSTSAEVSGQWRDLATSLQRVADQPSMADMMRMQTSLLQLSLQYELIGKAVARSTQNVENLVRMS